MCKGDEVGRDQRRRRYKRIRTQKETKRIKEQTQDLKKDINVTNTIIRIVSEDKVIDLQQYIEDKKLEE